MLFLFFICIGLVSASENVTSDVNFETNENPEVIDFEDNLMQDEVKSQVEDTAIETKDAVSYYKEKIDLTCYLKDSSGQIIQNKSLTVKIDNKVYNALSSKSGKITLPVNLKPNVYKVKIYFEGDEKYNASDASATVKIKKAPLAIKMRNYNTYVDSDLFFKVKVYNTVTKNTVSDIKVKFNVYNSKTKKYSYYYRTTNSKGIATLNKNFKVGLYRISAKIDDSKNKKYISYKNTKSKATMNVKPTAEFGCCSFYLQVNGTESIAGFRRDATNALDIYIKSIKFAGRTAIKQYKLSYSYFFHSITTSDGWMMGTGGIDNPSINKAIEKLAGKMVKSNKIQKSYLKKDSKLRKASWFRSFFNKIS